ncbi:MAG: DUF1611 domain-containing protein [Acidobacteriota bacterium]
MSTLTPIDSAVVLAHGLLQTPFAKTTHGLVRGPSRWPLAAVIDPEHDGADAGVLLDGRARDIPVLASVEQALAAPSDTPRPTHCVVGVATIGGVLPDAIRDALLVAARAGLTLVNGLHRRLADDAEIAAATATAGGWIVDLRKPPATLRFWSGEILRRATPRVAVLGTDCALGKRTTCGLLRRALADGGLHAEMVTTGQTGWLQGYRFGFVLDAAPNDFVCGELEHQLLRCLDEAKPDVVLIEGQSSLRNPSGPCGAELLRAAGAVGVVLQHAPGRRVYEGLDEVDDAMRARGVADDNNPAVIPSLASEVALIRAYGSEVWAVALHDEGLDAEALGRTRDRLESELGLPVVLPLDGADEIELLRRAVADRLAASAP